MAAGGGARGDGQPAAVPGGVGGARVDQPVPRRHRRRAGAPGADGGRQRRGGLPESGDDGQPAAPADGVAASGAHQAVAGGNARGADPPRPDGGRQPRRSRHRPRGEALHPPPHGLGDALAHVRVGQQQGLGGVAQERALHQHGGHDGVAQDVEARALDAAVRQAQRGDQLGLHVLRQQPRRRAGVVEVVRLAAAGGAAQGVVVDRHEDLGAGLVGDVHTRAQVGGHGGVGAVAAGEVRRPGEDRARAAAPQVAVEPQPDVQVDVLLQQHRPALGIGARRQPRDGARRQLAHGAGVAAPMARVDRHVGQRRGGGRDGEARREREGGGEGEAACAGDGWSFARGCPGPAGGHASRVPDRGDPGRFRPRRCFAPAAPRAQPDRAAAWVRAAAWERGAGGSALSPDIRIPRAIPCAPRASR